MAIFTKDIQNTILRKLKQLYKRLPVGFLIDVAYTNCTSKMAIYF